MKVLIIRDLSGQVETHQTELKSIKELLNYWKFTYGAEYISDFITGKFKYILTNMNDMENSISLREETLFTELPDYDTLLIIREMSGEVPVGAVGSIFFDSAAAFATTATTMETIGVYALTAVINMSLAAGVQMLMNSLAPTPAFTGDPVKGQALQSNLFNGARIIQEQGGSVPLLYGDTFAGGTLISSSVTTTQG
jgi:predicted phage tail protein